MSKDLILYCVYEDDSGHRYLIPKDEVTTLHEFIDDLLQALDTSHHRKCDITLILYSLLSFLFNLA